MEHCESCGNHVERLLALVKDGTVYEAYQCDRGHHVLVDTRRDSLPIELVSIDGVSLARVVCGTNCYIFDQAMFRGALRRVLELSRRRSGPLVLDLTEVGFVGEPVLSAVEVVDSGLAKRGSPLYVIAPSMIVTSELIAAVPSLSERVFADESAALEAAGVRTLSGAQAETAGA